MAALCVVEEHFNAEEQFDGDEQCYVAEQFDLEVSLMWRSSVTFSRFTPDL